MSNSCDEASSFSRHVKKSRSVICDMLSPFTMDSCTEIKAVWKDITEFSSPLVQFSLDLPRQEKKDVEGDSELSWSYVFCELGESISPTAFASTFESISSSSWFMAGIGGLHGTTGDSIIVKIHWSLLVTPNKMLMSFFVAIRKDPNDRHYDGPPGMKEKMCCRKNSLLINEGTNSMIQSTTKPLLLAIMSPSLRWPSYSANDWIVFFICVDIFFHQRLSFVRVFSLERIVLFLAYTASKNYIVYGRVSFAMNAMAYYCGRYEPIR